MSITRTMLSLKSAEEQEWKDLYNYIIELEKRNKEIYEGFMATTEELCEATKEIERLNNIINELEKDIENQIIFCTNEANGTTNDKYCRIAINYLKHLKDKLQELLGSDKE